MSECFFILAQVVITHPSVHIEQGQASFSSNLIVRLFVVCPSLIQDGSREVVQGALVIVHHHVALTALIVSHRELGVVDAGG